MSDHDRLHSTDAHVDIPLRYLRMTVYVLGGVGIALGTCAIIVSLPILPGWFPAFALTMLGITLATITAGTILARRHRRGMRDPGC